MNVEKIIERIMEKKLGDDSENPQSANSIHPMLGLRCICRTYSAGVHFGKVVFARGSECELVDSARLWSWKNGGLSLSAVNLNGMKGGRINMTGRIYLTEVIEFIPTTESFEASWGKYVES